MIPILTYFTYSISYHFIPLQLINARNHQGVPWLWLMSQSANLWSYPSLMLILEWQNSQKLLPTHQRQMKLSWWMTRPCILRIRPEVGQCMDMGKDKRHSNLIHYHPAVFMQSMPTTPWQFGSGVKALQGQSPPFQETAVHRLKNASVLFISGFQEGGRLLQRLWIFPCIWLLPCDKPIVLMRLQVCPFLKATGRMVLWRWAKEKDEENSKEWLEQGDQVVTFQQPPLWILLHWSVQTLLREIKEHCDPLSNF